MAGRWIPERRVDNDFLESSANAGRKTPIKPLITPPTRNSVGELRERLHDEGHEDSAGTDPRGFTNGQVVGMVSNLFTASIAEGARVAWLEDMVVHPAMRFALRTESVRPAMVSLRLKL